MSSEFSVGQPKGVFDIISDFPSFEEEEKLLAYAVSKAIEHGVPEHAAKVVSDLVEIYPEHEDVLYQSFAKNARIGWEGDSGFRQKPKISVEYMNALLGKQGERNAEKKSFILTNFFNDSLSSIWRGTLYLKDFEVAICSDENPEKEIWKKTLKERPYSEGFVPQF